MDARVTNTRRPSGVTRPERCDRIALVLQGGGALGAYQAGVYQALHEVGLEPEWVSGVSIGAINSAIIAGNPPRRRLERLRQFWERITERKIWNYTPDGDVFRRMRNTQSSWMTMMQGQPGFFTPRKSGPWLSVAGAEDATSYYDNAPLRETLLELVDFNLINEQQVRFSVGAVNVLNGNFLYFDNAKEDIEPEHIMASGALPPALPMTKIGTDYFWDGGIVSNTPLQHLLDQDDDLNTLVFQVDLFSARGTLPRDIQDVMARQKDIMYSSRTRYTTDVFRRMYNLKTKLHQVLSKVPEDQLSDDERKLKEELRDLPEIAILHLIYQQKAYESHAKDYEFSGTSMREHWQSGYEDTKRTLRRHDWLEIPPEGEGIVVHDVHREERG
ncbi:patatin-like phospholipase family protein [Pseudorhodoplanes sinuspersici]|uniref:patatin-like phospholipase family protein n=1 Tax=Pseudorhodoplanes sinuspersici TaxID=1235591 RepID=UPI000FF2CCEE|nr:patatin-like phospholipase family protein [Pseudorhodoplanes sinuspersici]RKE73117.1 NTE family protein [Pseudorhodoplanes sinuspersici]